MKTASRDILLLLIFLTYFCTAYALQGPGGREDSSAESLKGKRATKPKSNESKPKGSSVSKPTVSSKSKESISRRRPPAPARPLLAELIINVTPADSQVQFDSRIVASENGVVRLQEVIAGTHTINVSRASYRGAQSSVSLSAGESRVVNIDLTPLPGRLSITTTVSGATIIISNMGSHIENISNMELPPGVYEITVTRPGYQTSVRNIIIRPDELTNLLIPLERVPEKRRPADAAMAVAVSNEGKYLVISLTGASGATSVSTGSLVVTVDANDTSSGLQRVVGLLPGVPCRVDLVPLENVAELSFKEPPGISNQWRTVAVRIRPKNLKKAISFSINWKTLQ